LKQGRDVRALSSVARHGSARTSGASEVVETSAVTVENAGTTLDKTIEASGAP
jgi:hypothetical protein